MANIKIYKDKTVYPSRYDIINKFENKADKLTFDFSDIETQGNKYLVFEDDGKAKVPILMIDNAIEITNFISSKPGLHRALVIVSSVELDETLNISDKNIKFISNEFEIIVNDNFITTEATQEWELPNYLKIPFDELLALIEKVKNDLEIGAFTGNGIESIDKISSVKNTDTYRITFTNKETFDYTITNGIDGQTPVITIKNGYWHVNNVNTGQKAQGEKGDKGIGIRSIVKTSTNENIDTYTITFDNDTTSDFTVTNGVNGKDGKSSYEIAVEHGFEGTEEEWLESLEYQHSEEFAQLAEQIREDANTASSASQRADETVAQFSSDYTAKVNAFDKKVTDANNDLDTKLGQANTAIDDKIQEATKQAQKAKEEADRATQATDGKLDKNLGAENSDKVLITDAEGNVITQNKEDFEGGGTSDYNDLENKPQINGVELKGNKTSGDLKMYTQEEVNYMLADKMDKPYVPITIIDNATITDALEGNFKIDTIKGNTYQNVEENIVPTPSRPVPINSRKVKAGDEYVELRSLKESKNLFDKNLLVANSGDTQKDSLTIQLKDKETYTISCSKNGIECILGVRATKKIDSTDTEIMLLRGTTEQGSFTVDYSAFENYIIRIYKNAYDIIDNIQLEHGSVATAYVQATVRDYKIVDHVTKTSKIVRNVGLMLVDNNSGISLYNSGGTYGFNVNIKNLLANINHVAFCTTLQDYVIFAQKDTISCGIVDDFAYCFPSWVTKDMAADKIKEILKEKSFYIQYQLKTPTEEEITYSASDTSEVGYSWQDNTSPSLTIPSQIEGVNEIDITVTGKNLFDIEYVSNLENWTNSNTDGYFYIPIKVPRGKQLYLSNDKTLASGRGYYANISPYTNKNAENYYFFYHNTSGSAYGKFNGLTKDGVVYLRINYIAINLPLFIEDFKHLQIEVGDIATAYEPYTGQHISIALPQPMYSTLDGSIADEVDIESGNYKYYLKSVTFNGNDNESWSIGSGDINKKNQRFYILVNDIVANSSIICDKLEQFYQGNISEFNNNDFQGCNCSNGQYIQIKINKNYASNVQDLREWLKSNPLTFYYVTTTPTTQPIPEEGLAKLKSLKTNAGVNNIVVGGEVKPTIEARYPQDVVLAVNRLQNKLLTLQEEVVKNV